MTWCVLAFYVPYKIYSSVLKSEVLSFTQTLYQIACVALALHIVSIGIIISEWYEVLMTKNIPFIIVACILISILAFHVVTLIRIRKGTLKNFIIYIYAALVTALLVFSLYKFEKKALIFLLTTICIFAIWLIIRYGIHKYIKHFL